MSDNTIGGPSGNHIAEYSRSDGAAQPGKLKGTPPGSLGGGAPVPPPLAAADFDIFAAMPDLVSPTGEIDFLVLSQLTEKFQAHMSKTFKQMAQTQLGDMNNRLKQKLADQKKLWDKMDAAKRAARKNKLVGWVTKSLAVAGLALAMAALSTTGFGTVGSAALGVVMFSMLASSGAQLAAEAAGQDGWSYESALGGSLGTSGGMMLGGALGGNLGNLVAGIAMECGTDDPEKLAIVTGVFTGLQAILMMGSSMTVASGQAASQSVTAAQLTGTLTGAGTQITQGAIGLELAELNLDIDRTKAGIKQLEAILKFMEAFEERNRKSGEQLHALLNDSIDQCRAILIDVVYANTLQLAQA